MSELQEQLSTTIDTEATPSASGGGQPNLTEIVEPKAPGSLRDDLEAVFREEEDKADEKAEPKAKEPAEKAEKIEAPDKEKAEAPKAEKAEPAKEAPEVKEPVEKVETDKAEDKGKHTEPPKNFLPDSREVWRNVPRAVRRDIESMAREHETAIAQHRETVERYEALKPFDEIAKNNGRDLRESLSRVVEFENLLKTQPLAGLNRILMEAGPRKADGQPFSLYEVADFVVKQGPQGYQQMMAQSRPQQQTQQEPDKVAKLEKELEAMRDQLTVQPIIDRFASRNERYHELQDDIAFFLQSGKIPTSLGPEERLAAAYDMAVRINPPSNVSRDRPSAEVAELDPDRRAGDDFSGSKSIKSSPGSITETVEDQATGGESIRDSILKASRRLARA